MHEKYFSYALEQLTLIVNTIIKDLSDFSIKKLSIKNNEESNSELLRLYQYLIQLKNKPVLTPIVDTGVELSNCSYEINTHTINVIIPEQKKYVSIISFKEYHNVEDKILDAFLQSPANMIMCEIFYLVSKEEVKKKYKQQTYMLKVSQDKELQKIKQLDLLENEEEIFGSQQLSISIIENDPTVLNQKIIKISEKLSKLGIVHVIEDIDLESFFWAHLPGNFIYIKRAYYVPITNIGAFTSLHYAPVGNKTSIWGKAVTLLRTKSGTPYFFNFHVNNEGHTVIIGGSNSGKTVLTNFLLSQSNKFKPTILYLTNNKKSKIFIDALGGKWIEKFNLDISKYNEKQLTDFFTVLVNGYTKNLNDEENNEIIKIVKNILNQQPTTYNFEDIKQCISANTVLKERISYLTHEVYKNLFNQEEINFTQGGIIGCNLDIFTKQYLIFKYKPDSPKLIEQFEKNLHYHNNIKCLAVQYLIDKFLSIEDLSPKILVLNDVLNLMDHDYFQCINDIYQQASKKNCITINIINDLDILSKNNLFTNIINCISTTIVLHTDLNLSSNASEILSLNESEIDQIKKITLEKRCFFIKQDNDSLIAELSLGGLPGILKILSAQPHNLILYDKIKDRRDSQEDWVISLYNEFNC